MLTGKVQRQKREIARLKVNNAVLTDQCERFISRVDALYKSVEETSDKNEAELRKMYGALAQNFALYEKNKEAEVRTLRADRDALCAGIRALSAYLMILIGDEKVEISREEIERMYKEDNTEHLKISKEENNIIIWRETK